MIKSAKQFWRRLSAFVLAVLVIAGTFLSRVVPVHAADGTIKYYAGAQISYGSYSTSRMTFDGSNMAYCVEPMQATPASGTYPYNLLGKDSPIRKALYYLNGGYGYDKNIKKQYLSGWSDDNSYVIGHLAVSYIYAGYSADSGAFYGVPQSISFPEIGTTAKDGKDGAQEALAEKETQIIDMIELTSHEDIEDKSQTVKLTEIPPEPENPVETPSVPKTGDTTNLWIPIAVLSAAFIGIVAVIIHIRRKKF